MSAADEKGALPFQGRNASPQEGVIANPDPILEYRNEHRHEHLHHGGAAADHANHEHEVLYADTTKEKLYVADEKPGHFATGEKSLGDEESGNVGERKREEESDPSFLRIWFRKLRAPIHAFIWLVFTA